MGTIPALYRTDFPCRVVDRVALTMVNLRDLHGADACWPWRGARLPAGYGRLGFSEGSRSRKVFTYAHRVAWVAAGFDLPPDMTIDHVCGNTSCINVAHLRLLSLADNTREANRGITHCPHGHEYAPENTIWDVGGSGRPCRRCRICRRGRPS